MAHQLLRYPGDICERDAIVRIARPKALGVEGPVGALGLANLDHVARGRRVEAAATLPPPTPAESREVFLDASVHSENMSRL